MQASWSPVLRALRPYRDADPDRLKISGTGSWNLEAFLSPELRLAYREPHVLRSIPPNLLPGPDGDAEPRDRSLRLMRLWDSKGLLFISFQKKEQREVTRVFGSYKSETADRQIGERRGANSLEGRLEGPSRFLPPGHILCQLSVPPGHRLIGASTDRADFYHQARITASKAEGNCIGPSVRLGDLEGTATLARARALASLVDKKGAVSSRPPPLGEACLVSANVPKSLLLGQRSEVRQAKACYSQAGVAGSPHKDIDGSDLFLAAGAQVDSTAGPASEGRVYVSAPTPKLLALSFLSLKAAALPVITEELASNLAGSWISVVMYRRTLFSILDGFFSLGKSEASQANGSHLRFFPRKLAQELVLLACLAPVMVSNVAATFCDRIFCSDASMQKGAFCSTAASVEVAASLWLSADKKGCYTTLDRSSATAKKEEEDDDRDAPNEEPASLSRPLAFDFDALCLLSGSASLARAFGVLGFRPSPVIDLSTSPEYDIGSSHVKEWILYLLWAGKARSLVIVLPASASLRRSGIGDSHAKGPARHRLLGCCLSVFKVAVRAMRPAALLFPRSGEVLSTCAARGLLKVRGCHLLPPLEKGEPAAYPGVFHLPGHVPSEFFVSRQVPGLASQGLARLIGTSATKGGPSEVGLPAGLENVAVNEVLLCSPWSTDMSWRWDRQRHINALETESAVTNLRQLAREGRDCRSVHILDSSCARGALSKGRSSAKLLRPGLRRAASICVAVPRLHVRPDQIECLRRSHQGSRTPRTS
ncbi:unnamed protein product [Symbiodinium sp. CCMP2456]|nr:unnamed protein product [Symbiodinium sp. CCMP2456]